LNIQIINIAFPEIYSRYNKKFNFRSDIDTIALLGIEIRGIPATGSKLIQKIILDKKGIFFKIKNRDSIFEDILILGTKIFFNDLTREIEFPGIEEIKVGLRNTFLHWNNYDKLTSEFGGKIFGNNDFFIVGILNITPDSFSDGGKYYDKDSALQHALKMIDDGADIIDIGGESSRPGAEIVSADEEIKRVMPVIKGILKSAPDTVLSIDTTKKQVALEALKNGVKIVNDISAGNFDPDIMDIVKEYNAAIILMHMKGTPKTMQANPFYEDVVSEIYDFLGEKIEIAKQKGIKNIIIDPGIGFGKTVKDNYEIINRLDEFKGLGSSIMIGVSRKSFLGKSLNLDMTERDVPTIIAESVALRNGARFIRTHNVKNAFHLKKITNYLKNPEGINV
jgi:dihydropteroate synthase